jgi:hypothetical protein
MDKPVYDINTTQGYEAFEKWCREKAQYLLKTAPAPELRNPEAFWDFIEQEEFPTTLVEEDTYDDEFAEFVLVGKLHIAQKLFLLIASTVVKK